MTMKVHPFAAKFPMMEGEPFDELVESIRQHGLADPVVRKNGLILDGRNRVAACEKAGAKVRFVEYDDSKMSIIDYIGIHNLQRRNLTDDQRAMLVLIWRDYEADEGKKRRLEGARKGRATRTKQAKISMNSLRAKTPYANSESDESDDGLTEEENMQNTAGVADVGKKKQAPRARTKMAKRAGVSESRVRRAEKIKKHRRGKSLEKDVISGKKTIAAAEKETTPKKKRNMPVAAWNGLEFTNVILDDIRGNIKSKKPTKKQQKQFFDNELLEGLDVLEKELKL